MSEELKNTIRHTLDKHFKEGETVVYTWNGRKGKGVIKRLKRLDNVRNGSVKVRSALIVPDDGGDPVYVPLSVIFHAE